jgi:hypothetical protein
MIELHVKWRNINRDPEEVGSDFMDDGHGGVPLLSVFASKSQQASVGRGRA